MTNSRRTVLVAALTALVTAALVGVGTIAYANHQFSDVATGNTFHDSISNLVDAGCATGFPNGTYRPTESVNRQQIARMLNSCGGRLSVSDSGGGLHTVGTTDAVIPGSTATLTAGAVANAGLVLAIGQFEPLSFDDAGFPCAALASLVPNGHSAQLLGGQGSTETITGSDTAGSGTLLGAYTVDAGDSVSVGIQAHKTPCDAVVEANAEVVLLYVPFNGDGTGVGAPN
jgi:hypothetical protein